MSVFDGKCMRHVSGAGFMSVMTGCMTGERKEGPGG